VHARRTDSQRRRPLGRCVLGLVLLIAVASSCRSGLATAEPARDPRWLTLATRGGPGALCVVADLDDDGWQDVVIELPAPESPGSVLTAISTNELTVLRPVATTSGRVLDLAFAEARSVPHLVALTHDGTPRNDLVVSWFALRGEEPVVSWSVDVRTEGACVAVTTDRSGDGYPELVVGLPLAEPTGGGSRGVVALFDGATGEELGRCTPTNWGVGAGRGVVALGPRTTGNSLAVAVGTKGDAAIIDLQSCDAHGKTPLPIETGASALEALGDIDDDGMLDFVVACDGTGGEGYRSLMPPAVVVASGTNGHAVTTWRGPLDQLFGRGLAIAPSWIVVGAPLAEAGLGRVVALPLKQEVGPITLLRGTPERAALGASLAVAPGPDGRFQLVAQCRSGLVAAEFSALLSEPALDVTRE
jgi:hypothetical protein